MNALEKRRLGVASLLAIMLLTILAVLGLALGQIALGELNQAENASQANSAMLAAESGLNVLCWSLERLSVPRNASGDAAAMALRNGLAAHLEGSSLAHGSIVWSGNQVSVPAVALGHSQRFSALLTVEADNKVRVEVTGHSGGAVRRVAINCDLLPGSSPVFAYGIASRSPIRMTGNAGLEGVNAPQEAQVLSATYSDLHAVDLTGNVGIDGDVFVSNPLGYVSLTGNVSIGGKSGTAAHDHVHIGVGDVDFPEVDPTVFEPFATTVVDSSTKFNGNRSFRNIRIKAGTNPTFSGNITLEGVIYIEAPNRIHFSGNTTITGVIVTEDAGEDVYDENTIKFSGNLSASGVEELPDEPDFAQLRQMPGSFILAPGFGLEFVGNFGTVGGGMAADEFKFTGNAGGLVRGMIINYSDSAFTLTGNSRIRFDRSSSPDIPPGFSLPQRIVLRPDTYVELRGAS
jgi:Tfp pilus assembly protein PilX